ncbi:hypothetical protein EV424DRAFT_1347033 [Suillus variegatus]|nr:hypothetical protein EV424DRAFT_1347033 [Suillus variegatus]
MPSNALHPSSFHERQLDEKLQIACGCPRDLDETILATLLHPAFRQFIDDSQTHLTTEDDNNLVHKLTNVMLAFYENERNKVQGMAYVMDADMSVNIHNHCHPFVIAEFKNKATTSTSEPYIQALLYYLESTRIFTPNTDNQIASACHMAAFRIAALPQNYEDLNSSLKSVFEGIRQKLKTLHACKLVHGDICDTNILVHQTDWTKFMIIDFD